MADMTRAYATAIANAGARLITHLGLIDAAGVELSGVYARRAVAWAPARDGVIRPAADVVFDIPAGATVAGWRGFSDTRGGIDYGGAALTPETFAAQGQYTLIAAKTGIRHDAL